MVTLLNTGMVPLLLWVSHALPQFCPQGVIRRGERRTAKDWKIALTHSPTLLFTSVAGLGIGPLVGLPQ